MEPEILSGMLAHPAFDDRVDHLRCRSDIDLAVGAARQLVRAEPLDAEAMVRQADHPHPDNRAIEPPGETSHGRIGLAAPAEERDIDAAGEVLINQHAEMLAGGQCGGHLQRGLRPGADQPAHQRRSDPGDLLRHRLVVGHPVDHGRRQTVGGRGNGRQLPVRQMRGKAQRRLAVGPQPVEQRHTVGLDASGIGMVEIKVPDARHVHILAGDPAEIVPCLAQRRLDPGAVLVGEGGTQVVLADPVRRQPWPDAPSHRAAEVRRAIGISPAQQPDHPLDQATEDTLAVQRELASHPGQSSIRSFPNTSRLSSRSTPARKSARP